MSDITNTPQDTATQPETTPQQAAATTQAGQTTQTAATSIDVASIMAHAEAKATKEAERKMQNVFKSMLEQNGLDADTVKKMTAEWKGKQTTPEDTIKKLQDQLDEANSKISSNEKANILRGHGLTDPEDIEVMAIRIDRLVTDKKTFEEAAKEYYDSNKKKDEGSEKPTVPPATWSGGGKAPVNEPSDWNPQNGGGFKFNIAGVKK